MSDTRRRLDGLREKLAKLDEGLIDLLEARAKIAKEASPLREENPSAPPFPHLAEMALARTKGDMPEGDLRRIVFDIHAACSALERPARVVFAGPYGGVAHAATRRRFGVSGTPTPKETAALAIEEVVRKREDIAVVPLESSDDGPVQGTVLALSETDLKISEVIEQSNELHAFRLARAASVLPKRLIATHGDADASSRFVASMVAEGVELVHAATSIDACKAAAADELALALAQDPFGVDQGLVVARTSVGDTPGARTRFGLVSHRPHPRTGKDATALVLTVRDSPGALLDVLRQFAERDINLTNIYSRPIKGESWSYLFFVEISGHFTDRAVVTACEDVRKITTLFKVVGAYPAG